MMNRNSCSKAKRIAKRSISTVAVLGFLVFAGCASSEPSAAQQAALAKTELHFDINTCQESGQVCTNVRPVDKPICSPDYNGQAECVRIGPEGQRFRTEWIRQLIMAAHNFPMLLNIGVLRRPPYRARPSLKGRPSYGVTVLIKVG